MRDTRCAPSRRRSLGVAISVATAVGVLAACGSSSKSGSAATTASATTAASGAGTTAAAAGTTTGALTSVTLLMPGSASAAVGGFYDPMVNGIAAKHGIKINYMSAGQGVFNTIPQVASGQAHFSLSDSADLYVARSKNIPVEQIYATYDDPPCLMYHPDSGISSFADLSNHEVAVTPGASWWLWAKQKFNITGAKEVAYTGSIAPFAADKNLSQQCYYTNEPFQAQQQGIPNGVLVAKDYGWDSYGDVLFTTDDQVKNDPTTVRNLVQAIQEGWTDYLANPAPVFSYLTAQGDKESAAQQQYVVGVLNNTLNAGKMGVAAPDRMSGILSEMQGINLVPASTTADSAYTNQFVNPQ